MAIPIIITSPINKIKVKIGEVDPYRRTAVFWINQKRMFQEAESIGPDVKGFDRKAVKFCEWIELVFEGKIYRLRKQEFEKNCWRYPKKDDPSYKANSTNFAPKYFISLEKLARLTQTKKERDDEITRLAIQ